jgi:regulator of sigma E protease
MSWVLAILALGFLVMVHEFGHFSVAKALGMKVDVFSVGFGPAIPGCRWEKGGTEFVISWIPLGGYVKIAGSNPDDEEDYDPEDPKAFLNQPAWKRMAVVAAGPGINYVLAWLMALTLFLAWGLPVKPARHPLHLAQIDRNKAAAKAGMQPGDQILAIDGQRVESYHHYRQIISMYLRGCRHVTGEKKRLALEVAQGTKRRMVDWVPDPEKQKLGFVLLGPAPPSSPARAFLPHADQALVVYVSAERARAAGLRAGDRIVSVDGHPLKTKAHLRERIARLREGYRCSRQMEHALVFTVKREGKHGKTEKLKVYPDPQGMIGVVFRDVTVWETVDIGERLTFALGYPIRKSHEMLSALGMLFSKLFGGSTGAASHIAGPVGIVVAIKTQIRQGFLYGLSVVMFLSVMLGLFNLLPIPALDGGHLAFRLIELITGKRMPPRKEARVHQYALLALLLLFVAVTIKDCRGLFGI